MRALELNDSYRPVMDGVAICTENYARHLRAHGMHTAVATPRVPQYEDTDEFPVFRYASLPIPGWNQYRLGAPRVARAARRRILAWLTSGPADESIVLHAHTPFASLSLARLLSRALLRSGRRAHVVGTLHSKYEDDFRRVVPDALAHRLTRHAVGRFRLVDSVWAPNAGTLDTLRSYGYHGSVIVMPNGSDFGRPPADELAAMRRRGAEIIGRPPPSAGIDASDGDAAEIVLLYVGQMRWEKNVRVILEALGRLAGEHRLPRRVSMVFVGSGPDMDGIRSLSRKLSLAAESNPRVVYLGAIYDRDVLAALYARADVFVFPSVYDNAPLVIREAAAFGTPSVLAAGSNSARDTADGHSAFHVQPNAEALAATLAGLVARPDRIAAVGRGAARDLYAGWQEVAARVAAHYRRIESL